MAYHLSFQEYLDLNEGLLKKWQNQILGRDKNGKANLATAHAVRHKDDIANAASGVSNTVGNVASVAGNIATGNVVGVANSIWNLISDAVKGGSGVYKATKASMYILEIKKHMTELKTHLIEKEELEEETANAIIDAVFEVDENIFHKVSPDSWAEGTKRFAQGLAGGYDNINEKIFAAVMAQVIKEWIEEIGGKVEGLKSTVARLRGEKRQKIDFLEEPEIKEAMSEFDPPRVHKDLQDDVKQLEPGTPRTLAQLEKKWIQLMNWPKLPKDGDQAYVRYRGDNYGIMKLDTKLSSEELNTIQQRGWRAYAQSRRWMGKVVIPQRGGYTGYEVSFGYDADFGNLPKWDQGRQMWVVHADYD